MGYLYIKIIESKKVAIRNSFFVNYPFIRVVVAKEKKSTNFKPGVEWWDKILNFRFDQGEHQQIIIQARDKSIHVFGSDWLGEIKLDLDKEGFLDGQVHQMWFKFGRGRKSHSRAPRGYIHVAFHYFTESNPVGKRPFSTTPVEKVLTFEEWLASNNANWSSDSSQWLSSSTNNLPVDKRSLRKSSELTPDSPRKAITSQESIDEINPDKPATSASQSRPKTRPRAATLPELRSPSVQRQDRDRRVSFSDEDNSKESSDEESDEEPRIGTLIDFSFDAPNDRMSGHHKRTQKHIAPTAVTPTQASTPVSAPMPKFASIDDQINHIKKLSLHSSTPVAPLAEPSTGFESLINHEPTFTDWYHVAADPVAPTYNPKNPFLSMHENLAPTYSVQK